MTFVNKKAFESLRKTKPFLKWAGGKTQLLSHFQHYYPNELKQGKITTYIEPFLGSGAVFLDIIQHYPIKKIYLNDINKELILSYHVLKQTPDLLIEQLNKLQQLFEYLEESAREQFFYQMRLNFNQQRLNINYANFAENWIERAAQLIFLNKTCFNGLFRLNAKGEFNVPFGHYKKPCIVDSENLKHVSQLLQQVELFCGHYQHCLNLADKHSFIYFDPPYRPLSKTAHFTCYTGIPFDDKEQQRLAQFFNVLHQNTGAKLMLSNSDPKNIDINDHFFDILYQNHNIQRIPAKRMINSVGKKRGIINEILVMNYRL